MRNILYLCLCAITWGCTIYAPDDYDIPPSDDDSSPDDYCEDSVWYLDSDSDGHGWWMADLQGPCEQPEGYVANRDDCDDSDAARYPGAQELCDGVDQDCDDIVPADEIDNDGDGLSECAGDCVDTDASISPSASEICDEIDNDCDSLVDEGFDWDADGYSSCDGEDCDDAAANIHPGAGEWCDGLDDNCDGLVPESEFDPDGDGVSACAGDCDPFSSSNFPGNTEVCDGQDNTCDSIVDEGFDLDGDGWTVCNSDCDDADAAAYPTNPELCDSIDNNCDGMTDEGFDPDGDGYTHCQGDCNNMVAATNPGAPESCDTQDNDCDGIVPGDEIDNDADGWVECSSPLLQGGDCDDSSANVHPGAVEICDMQDNDCNSSIPGEEMDWDGDSLSQCAGDCDNGDANVFPGAAEICDGIDNNCDQLIDDADPALDTSSGEMFFPDSDTDGFGDPNSSTMSCEVQEGFVDNALDCDDDDPVTFPNAPETCDGVDNDCDGSVDENLSEQWYVDGDGDLHGAGSPIDVICNGDHDSLVDNALDCDDDDPTSYPDAPELPDEADNDCDGTVDEGTTLFDDDGDGFTEEAGDCDDANASVYPGAFDSAFDEYDADCDGLED